MTLYEENDFNNSEIDINDLTVDERSGYLTLPCYAVFTDLAEIGKVEDFDARWSLTLRIPKDGTIAGRDFSGEDKTYGSLLFAVSQLIGEKTWKADSDEKLDAVWGCIENGIGPKQSNISVQDGDLLKPEYNAGQWVLKASRREDEGQPPIYDTSGNPIFDDEGELVGEKSQVVRPGDYCIALIRVWAQKKQDRINFTLEGVRLVKRGAGAKAANALQRKNALGALAGGGLPELPADFDEDEEDEAPTKAVAKRSSKKKKAASKKTTPKKAAKKKGSVFRKGGKK